MESKHSTLDKSIVIGPVIGLYKMSEVSDWLSRSKPASKPAVLEVLEPSGVAPWEKRAAIRGNRGKENFSDRYYCCCLL